MQLRVMTEPQEGATYDDLLRGRAEAERLGFDAFFRSDHYQRIGPATAGPGSTDAWATLAGLARDTRRIRLGTMVIVGDLPAARAAGHHGRHGRRDERRPGRARARQRLVRDRAPAYGIPFPPVGERFDRLEEQLAIVTGLWATPRGRDVLLRRRALLARPTARRCRSRCSSPLPIVIGGKGQAADAGAGGPVRRRVQRAVRHPGRGRRLLRPGAAGLRGGRPRPGRRWCCRRPRRWPSARTSRRYGRRAAAIGGDAGRAAGGRVWAAPRPRWSTRSAGSRSSGPAGSTCR